VKSPALEIKQAQCLAKVKTKTKQAQKFQYAKMENIKDVKTHLTLNMIKCTKLKYSIDPQKYNGINSESKIKSFMFPNFGQETMTE
jgi:hypothetical protein